MNEFMWYSAGIWTSCAAFFAGRLYGKWRDNREEKAYIKRIENSLGE